MKKTLFSLEEIMPSNIYKNNKDNNLQKNKDRENKRSSSIIRIKKKQNKSKQKNLQYNNKPFDFSKTPVKIIGKVKINNNINNFNECSKNNNNIFPLQANGKQMLLLEYFLQNNNKNVKTNIFLINSKKDENKTINKVTRSLFPKTKNINNTLLQNTRYFNIRKKWTWNGIFCLHKRD